MRTVAAIDIGTNSVLLLVARGDRSHFETLCDACRITRLGQGIAGRPRLHAEAVSRTLAALREVAELAKWHRVDEIRAVGTSALRDAENGEDFLGPARGILGCDVEVISGEREAELTFRGATVGLLIPAIAEKPVTVFDVGGGSTEFVVGIGAHVHRAQSINIGSVRLHEEFVRGDPPTIRELAELRAAVRSALETLTFPLEPSLIGIAGTVTTLAAVRSGAEFYDREQIHGATLARSEVEGLLSRFASLRCAERARIAGLDPARADVIVAGCAIVLEVLDFARSEVLVVSDGGVRVGLALQILELS